ncbi:MAG: hypothetical protein LC798_13525 [Chloroflexi bacterium]|nr:hypothetical protein [Chloroflexota bacterium]
MTSLSGNGRPDPMRHLRVRLFGGGEAYVDHHCLSPILDAINADARAVLVVGMGGQQMLLSTRAIQAVDSWGSVTIDRVAEWHRVYRAMHREIAPEHYAKDPGEDWRDDA